MIRVLVVDDDFMVARLHASVVAAELGFQLAGIAHTGTEALALTQRLKPDLLLLDIYLPDLTGLDVLGRLRGGAGRSLDVIMISAARDVATIRRSVHGGAFQYLVKPFEIDTLRERLKEYAAHRRTMVGLDAVSQDDVDKVFRTQSQRASMLPKNISRETLELVVRALERADEREGMSALECAASTGLSRSSARRYLDHLVGAGRAHVKPKYGAAGRPERRYHPVR